MKNKVEVIALIMTIGAIYAYIISILVRFGYNSYFNIPSEFISFSIRENTIFFHSIFSSIFEIIVSFKSWSLSLSFILVIIFSIILFFRGYVARTIMFYMYLFLLVLASILFLSQSVHLGNVIAREQLGYYVLDAECLGLTTESKYVVSNFYNSEVVVIEIDKDSKLKPGFFVRKLSDLNCVISFDPSIGPIKK